VREEACIGAATILHPWTLRLILNAAALVAASPTLLFRLW
jgi:2-keto-3-deoxy-6-phosphogluconate aldolase